MTRLVLGRGVLLLVCGGLAISFSGCASPRPAPTELTVSGGSREVAQSSPREVAQSPNTPPLSPLPPAIPGPVGECSVFDHEIREAARESGHPEWSEKLVALAHCESGKACGKKVRSPRGRYRGAFQFAPATWRIQCVPRFRDQGRVECARPEAVDQARCAALCVAQIVATSGWSSWPHCSRKLQLVPRRTKRTRVSK